MQLNAGSLANNWQIGPALSFADRVGIPLSPHFNCVVESGVIGFRSHCSVGRIHYRIRENKMVSDGIRSRVNRNSATRRLHHPKPRRRLTRRLNVWSK